MLQVTFPIRESTIFSFSEFTARALGLLFLAKYVSLFGLGSSGLFRTVLPFIGIAAAIGSVGIPQALTRLVSACEVQTKRKLYRDHLAATIAAMVMSMVSNLGMLFGLIAFSQWGHLADESLVPLLLLSIPVLLVTCISGALRGIFVGLGMNFVSAVSQILEACVRLLLVMAAASHGVAQLDLTGAEAGIYMITTAETASMIFLILAFVFATISGHLPVLARSAHWHTQIRTWWSVLRMAVSPTAQSLLASAGYAIELPLAEHFLALKYGAHQAEVMIAEYAAVAIPLLCAPMFVTDGMATALLPALTAQRAQLGSDSLTWSLRSTIRAVSMLAVPASAALYVLAFPLCRWFGAAHAVTLLCWLAPLALPLYLQAPLASVLQAQGQGRALLYSSLFADVMRIAVLYMLLGPMHLSAVGLVLACAASVLAQTAVLLYMSVRVSPISPPWATLCHSLLCSVVVAAVCMVGLHTHGTFAFSRLPFVWIVAACLTGGFYLFVAGEISPRSLGRLPIAGPLLKHTAERTWQRLVE